MKMKKVLQVIGLLILLVGYESLVIELGRFVEASETVPNILRTIMIGALIVAMIAPFATILFFQINKKKRKDELK